MDHEANLGPTVRCGDGVVVGHDPHQPQPHTLLGAQPARVGRPGRLRDLGRIEPPAPVMDLDLHPARTGDTTNSDRVVDPAPRMGGDGVGDRLGNSDPQVLEPLRIHTRLPSDHLRHEATDHRQVLGPRWDPNLHRVTAVMRYRRHRHGPPTGAGRTVSGPPYRDGTPPLRYRCRDTTAGMQPEGRREPRPAAPSLGAARNAAREHRSSPRRVRRSTPHRSARMTASPDRTRSSTRTPSGAKRTAER